MLSDPRIARMARVLVCYSMGVKPGWSVTISATTLAVPLVEAVYAEVLASGAHPFVLMEPPSLKDLLLLNGSAEQLSKTDPYKLHMFSRADALLRILSDENTRASSAVDPTRLAIYQESQRPLGEANSQRIVVGKPSTLTLYPTPAYAQDAEMSLSEYEDFVFHACLLDGEEDPIARWEQVSREQQRVVDWLTGRKMVHIEAPGTDLEMSIEGRVFVNSDGKRNFPSGEVFTSPVDDSTGGHITFTYPTAYNGRVVRGVRLTFEHGKVTEFSAESGEEYLATFLAIDPGAKMLGEFAIGTNRGVTKITHNTLFDEKIAGTIHIALGNAYPNAGGINRSAIHWDMVTGMRPGRIQVDGDTLYEDGEFTI